MMEKPNNICYDLNKCYIISLCKYMFKKSSSSCLKNLPKKQSLHNVETQTLKCLMSDLEYFILIKFIPNQSHVSILS
jgi:hypothetical protein